MKRLFSTYIQKVMDYTTEAEAKRHIEQMTDNGWKVKQEAELPDGKYGYTVYYEKFIEI